MYIPGKTEVDECRRLIEACEADLGKLSSGEKRDLLMDRTQFNSIQIRDIVATIEGKV